LKKLVIVAIAVAFFISAVGAESCGGGPSGDLEVRWANAACAGHGGIEKLTEYDEVEAPANVICRDGAAFSQRYNGEDSANEWETPFEMRNRSGE